MPLENEAQVTEYIQGLQVPEDDYTLDHGELEGLQTALDEMIATPDGSIIPQHVLVEKLLDEDFRERVGGYYMSAILAANIDSQIIRSHQVDKEPFPDNPRAQEARRIFFEKMEDLSDLNPLQQETRGKEFFDRLQFMSPPLREDDRLYLNEIFEGDQDIDDVRLELFLAVASTTGPDDWRVRRIHPPQRMKGARKLQEMHLEYFQKIGAASRRYFEFYRDTFWAGYFPSDFPLPSFEVDDLRPVIEAVFFARTTNRLPTHFAQCIRENAFPNLTDETKEVLIKYYQQRFEGFKELQDIPDDNSLYPYEISLSEDGDRQGREYFRSLVHNYMQGRTMPERPEIDNIMWLVNTNDNRFPSVRKMFSEFVESLGGDTGIKAIDSYSYVDNILDITLIAEDDRVYTIQVGSNGYITGMPQEIKNESLTYVNYLVGKVREKYEAAKSGASRKAPKPAVPSSTPTQIPSESPFALPTVSDKLTHDERKAEYEAWAGKIELKRKKLRALGLLPPEATSDVTLQVEGRREAERTYNIDLQPTGRYTTMRDVLLGHRPQLANRLEEILTKLATNQDYLRNHLKPLQEINTKYPGMSAYSVRLGRDYRIILISSTTRGQLIMTSVRTRGIAYDDLDSDFEEAIKFLGAQSQ